MRLALTPRTTEFYDFFTEAGQNALETARLAERRFREFPERKVAQADVKALETRGDDITREIIDLLNTQYITPFDREDIYSLASSLDDIMDFMEEAVDLVVLYNIEELPKGVEQQIEVLARAAELTAEAMPHLRTMDNLTEYWIEVNRLENQADQIHRKLLAHLFNGKYDAIEVLKLKQIVDVLEEAADAFEHVANTVETIAVKES